MGQELDEIRERITGGKTARGPDGLIRTPEAEKKLNEMAVAVFGTKAGGAFLDYLKSITLNAVMPPDATDAQLRHREGMRDLVRIIQNRLQAGKGK